MKFKSKCLIKLFSLIFFNKATTQKRSYSRLFLDPFRGAVFTALSTTSVNIQFLIGNGFPNSFWHVKREDGSEACQVWDGYPLKDCTAEYAHPGKNLFRLNGLNLEPRTFFKSTLASNRMMALHCCSLCVQLPHLKAPVLFYI